MQKIDPTLGKGDTAAQLLAISPATSTPVVSGLVLVRLHGHNVVQTLAAFPNTSLGQPAQEEPTKILTLIAETDEDESVREAARSVVEEL